MKAGKTDAPPSQTGENGCEPRVPTTAEARGPSIGNAIDHLVEYLVDNHVNGIHPLIMGEVEKRLIIRVLQRSRGNKLQAARLLGMSRNTFHRKIQRLMDNGELDESCFEA
jgi:DNA-binding protein Fis